MQNPTENSKSESKPAGIGLGERLQAARIQQGLSVEDIATRMHLNVQIVKAIEDNNFDDITAPIFVKGYLRAYARILSLDEEEMIQQYANYYSHEDPPIATTSNMAPELSVADVRIKWTTYLVIVGLAALLAAWWWNKNQEEATPISLDSQRGGDTVVQSGADSGAQPPAEQASDAPDSGMGIMGEPPPSAETAAGEPASAEPAAPRDEVAQSDSSAAAGTTAPQSNSEEAAAAPAQADAAEPAAPPAPAAESPAAPAGETQSATGETATNEPRQQAVPAAPEPVEEAAPAPMRLGAPILTAPTGSDKLTLTINADTWADIKDGTGFQMVYHLLRAGQSLELTGSAPFTVFLGNGPGVEISFNGEAIEFSSRIRNDNTVRLKVGG